mgnify:CR=1 FL=1
MADKGKQLKYDSEARQALMRGVEKLSRAVNVTLGLPFIRTSVDHGTAYEIAGLGCARPQGMISALRWALRLKNR